MISVGLLAYALSVGFARILSMIGQREKDVSLYSAERSEAERLLKAALNDPCATFHPGQWEAISALAYENRKLLLVQRTGWGKSAVYFITTRILRDRGMGPTVILSPLKALMRNQVVGAQRLGIRAETVNSSNPDDWYAIKRRIFSDEIDTLLISPERLANDRFVEEWLRPIAGRIGLLVVDEAHCISDWGHDFRPDYRRLVEMLKRLPRNMPVLGTTATANDRVIEDVQGQLGNVEVIRGTLERKSLSLYTLRLSDRAARLAWLAQHIPKLPGTGIVYVLTKNDAQTVADWLEQRGVSARAYYNGVSHDDFSDSDQYRLYLEDLLLRNKVKVLVATVALGMGYDKPDLGFVIHYQSPGSVIAYYQQVGRAGRAIDRAYGVLLGGEEDYKIHDYFWRNAFPDEDDVQEILLVLERSDGLSVHELQSKLNMHRNQIKKVLKFLSVENPSPVSEQESRWFRNPVPYRMDYARIARINRQRRNEWQEIQEYIDSKTCLMACLRNSLDEPAVEDCGRCAICLGRPLRANTVDEGLRNEAARFLGIHNEMPAKPRLEVPRGAFIEYRLGGKLPQHLVAAEGRILSRWNDSFWGSMVAADKTAGHFRDGLVEAVAEMYERRWLPTPAPQWVTCVPSLRHPELVSDFAERLANRLCLLDLRFLNVIDKVTDAAPQKSMQNEFYQCRNLDGAFEIAGPVPSTPVLLIDDIIDSRLTMTVLAALLRQAGSGPVFPLALASTSKGE